MRWVAERRARPSPPLVVGVAVASVVAALAVGGLFLWAAGHSPPQVLARMVRAAFGSPRSVSETFVSATPLILTGAAAAVAFKMRIWNIGAEGQLYAGAIATAGLALALGEGFPGGVGIPLILLAGAVAGAAWALLAALPRAYLATNEIITTLMLNFVALHLMNYLIFGSASPWRDPAATNFPQGNPIPAQLRLPALWGRLGPGFLVAVGLAVLLWWAVRTTRWGFERRVVGDSEPAARYSGMDIRRGVIGVLCLSGALAGLAGGVLVAGLVFALEPRSLAIGLGFAGIIVAALARLDLLGLLPVAVLLGALNNTGSALQTARVPIAIVLMLQGLILLFAVAGEYFLGHRLRLVREEPAPPGAEAA